MAKILSQATPHIPASSRSNRIQSQADPLRGVKKSWKKAANKVTCNLKRMTHDSYATLPSNFTEDQLRSLWLELEHNYFDFGEDELGISKEKTTLREFLDFHNKFIKSFQYEPTHSWHDIKSTVVRKVHKKQAKRFADVALEQLSKTSPYHLRSMNGTNYNENYLAHKANLGEFAQKLANPESFCLKDHLYLEAMMQLEPLIDESNYEPAHMAGKAKKLRSVQGAAYDFQGHTGFDTLNKRTLYVTELASSIMKLFPGLEKIKGPVSSTQQSLSNGPNIDVFVQFYLAYLANLDNHGKCIVKEKWTGGDEDTGEKPRKTHSYRGSAKLMENSIAFWGGCMGIIFPSESIVEGWFNFSYEFQEIVPKTNKVEKYRMKYHDLEQNPEKISKFRAEIQVSDGEVLTSGQVFK